MTRDERSPIENLMRQVRACLDAAASQPGLVKASVYQTEGYLRGIQGLAWEPRPIDSPAPEDAAARFLHDVRTGGLPRRGQVKKKSAACLSAFSSGLFESFPEAREKKFTGALVRLWVRWLAGIFEIPAPHADALEFSMATGRRAGEILKSEYAEGVSGNLPAFILDRRLHLDGVRDFLRMRGWLLGTIEHLRRDERASHRERAEILHSNFASIVLRALHNGAPDYAARAAGMLESMTSELDRVIGNLEATEPEASRFLKKYRSTVITRALHSGHFDYGARVAQELPLADSSLNSSDIYRAITNGRLDLLRSSR